jgi:ABC-type cobalamin transport system ATPase subunit
MGEPESLGAQLRRSRLRRFVGRSGEVELLRHALDGRSAAGDSGEVSPFRVLFLHGPGGVGKSTLIDVFADVTESVGARVVRLDARLIPPTRAAILESLGDRLAGHDPPVLLVSLHHAHGFWSQLRRQ